MSDTTATNLEVRRLWPSDMEAYRDHLLRLDPRSRHERFGGGMSDDFLVHYAEHCFGQGDLLYGAFIDGRARRRGGAALQHRRSGASRPRSAGTSMPRRPFRSRKAIAGAASARNSSGAFSARRRTMGSRRSRSSACPTISGCGSLAQKFKTHFTFEECNLTGRLRARRPTPFSLMREAAGDAVDFGVSLFDAQWRA